MKVLIITNLFPNRKEPNRAVFNKQQFRELAKLCDLRVVAPIPFFKYSLREVPEEEIIDDIIVYHPRYLVIPKILRSLYGLFFFFGVIGTVRNIYKSFKFDIILASWAYPDGFGSALIGKVLRKPLIIKVHGTDVNVLTRYFLRRKMILYAFRKAEKIIAVSNALKDKIIEIGIPSEKIEVIPNGIDADLFKPMDKEECRKRLNLPLDKKIVLYVGNLELVKGMDVLIDAMKDLAEDIYLAIVGEGSLGNRFKKYWINSKNHWIGGTFLSRGDAGSENPAYPNLLKDKICFFGSRPHFDIPLWLNSCDVFCLPSRNEGCPNVLLEALACGVPIVASRIDGISEIIKSEEYGILVTPESSLAISEGIKKILQEKWDKEILRHSVLNYVWRENAKRVFSVLDSLRSLEQYSSSEAEGRVEKNRIKNIIKECTVSIIPKQWIIWHANRNYNLNRIALTFDDGPNPEYTPKVLDILNKYDVKATFFLIGCEVERFRDLAKRIVDEGHSVGNHSYSHKGFKDLNSKKAEFEILKTEQIFLDIFGRDGNGKLFRPPQGILSLGRLKAARKLGFTTVLWSQELGKMNSDLVKSGDIILFHDDNDFTLEALPVIIEGLKKKDYQFVTVDEMIKG